jgi:hypothetical protein
MSPAAGASLPLKRELLSLQEVHSRNKDARAADAGSEQEHETRVEFGTRHRGRLPARRPTDRNGPARAARVGKHHDIVGKRLAGSLEIHRRGLFGCRVNTARLWHNLDCA